MENAYLALRWNNHSSIFTKILNHLREQEAYTDVSLSCEGRFFAAHKFVLSTCSDYFKTMFSKTPCKHPIIFLNDVGKRDVESLLDFMYKGEVHVPQSELGSLLRTAEALQVKGLAVPDDTAQSTKSSPTTSDVAPSVPLRNSSFPVKRKKSIAGNRRDELPKLTPSQELSSNKAKSKTIKNRVSSMPLLKRFKASFEEGTNSKTNQSNNNSNVSHNHNNGSQSSEEQLLKNKETAISADANSQEQNGLIPISRIKEEILESNCDEEQPLKEEEENASFDHEYDTEGQYYIDEEEEDQGADENSFRPSEGDENSASNIMGNLLQTDLLQVDLSEDGTQFIIGPGVIGGEASKVSSSAEEETERPKKPFVCVLCGHTFTRRDNLANHLKTHTGDRPYMCQYCHKCFSRKDYLKQHERIHTGEKPHTCPICGRAFTRKEGLTDHMRCHSDFKAFSCETCGKSFKQKCGLRFHKRNYKH